MRRTLQFSLVSDQNDQLLPGNRFDDVHDFYGIFAVQISRRFIGDDDFRVLDDGAGDADSLPLAPESIFAGRFLYLSMPTLFRMYMTRSSISFLSLIPIIFSTRATFSKTVSSSIRL